MRKEEQKLWDTMKRRCSKLEMDRVENVMVPGMPDVYIINSSAWVELKSPIVPKRPSTRLLGGKGLSVDQINWHLRASKKGRKVYTLIRDSIGRLAFVPAIYSAHINNMTCDEIQRASVANHWEGIVEILEK